MKFVGKIVIALWIVISGALGTLVIIGFAINKDERCKLKAMLKGEEYIKENPEKSFRAKIGKLERVGF